MENQEDVELIKKYIKGDKESLDILIKNYFSNIYNFVYNFVYNKTEAEDITQDIFVKMWKNIKKFNQDKNFKSWLFVIAKNTAIDFLRKKKSFVFSEFDNEEGDNILLETIKDEDLIPDEILEKKDLKELLNNAISKLSLSYRTVIILHHVEEMTFREISEILKEPIDTVKSRYRRGIIILRNLLK
ncbi:MAG: RNA polymerase sigma factor [Patescibacteria group bacterium]|nr:RNA polymerase sigma factor [Patescibacteria group bacterium]MDD4304497.1 RNA polymerase sigma factor [Patescibacteria group bacterium]MDD4694857.1 RNA polymerase sigma factor [Patescibacteria group bacterium]